MQRKLFYNLEKNKKYREILVDTKYWSPVVRNGWIIKFSVYANSNILIFFISQYTGQTIIRYFTHEDDAVKYINFICLKDPTDLLEGDENPA
jgi:hypothetical protein